jgi:Xaa-Pro dipeptidase
MRLIRVVSAAFVLMAVAGATLAQPAVSLAQRQADTKEKQQRLIAYMEQHKLGAMMISNLRNFSWITDGGDTHIVITSEVGPVALLFTADGRKYLVANGSEAPRLMDEQLTGLGYELAFFKWYADKTKNNERDQLIKRLTKGKKIASDVPYANAQVIPDDEFAELRVPLTDTEIGRYRWLGRECGRAVKQTAEQIKPGMTEDEIEALTSDNLMTRGIRPTVLLIAVDDRILKYRHAIPNGVPLQKYAMINICARKWGLVIAMTRFVHFGPMPDDLAKKFEACAKVDAAYLGATKPGAVAGDILAQAERVYADVGYPGEWEQHHQGGAVGYNERDWVTYPGCPKVVHERQAFAWNPTIQGAKMEDTILCMRERNEVLTAIEGWPKIQVDMAGETWQRPGVLIREARAAALPLVGLPGVSPADVRL